MRIIHWCLGIILVSTLTACGDNRTAEERYADALEAVDYAQERTDELLNGIEFGMRPEQFSAHMDKLAKEGFLQIKDNNYILLFPLEHVKVPGKIKISPRFTPTTSADEISVLFALYFSIRYDEWVPQQASSTIIPLLRDVTRAFSTHFGSASFLAILHDKYGRLITQIDNNRRIVFWRANEEKVLGQFLDLTFKPDAPLIDEFGHPDL